MYVKVKSSVFIDALRFELTASRGLSFRGVLKDDTGIVCSTLEKDIATNEREEFTWSGLNDLPYGKYTLELSHGEDEMKMHLVKRI